MTTTTMLRTPSRKNRSSETVLMRTTMTKKMRRTNEDEFNLDFTTVSEFMTTVTAGMRFSIKHCFKEFEDVLFDITILGVKKEKKPKVIWKYDGAKGGIMDEADSDTNETKRKIVNSIFPS
uniref:Uncharacterized protein n=1 Tax=Chromera velia CCMP2878 TaxID=1169474 RepID=A0A0G4I069_9ALVE|eukprot:Cvel_9874.t1-p1 / transcript=Cvel_9874.t1 / gene=Cvel_9874 / organism=Chromera_velia_CCMP2878 / gene_product=hypothetical protein / transcript_product=hypothetical protein / location=Cvel_scaffold582:38030-38389(-) / protein_length=120 / sequence_SO=supercontig / SO=protein_coding / is_pseudo=false